MGNPEVIPFFLLFSFFFLFFPFSHTAEICRDSACGVNRPVIRFPFRIKGLQPKPCGYPGFDLTCNNRSRTVLELPSLGGFWVRAIDYAKQEIHINDPDNCLPKRLLSFDLSSSPFSSFYYQSYTLLNCPSGLTIPQFTPIACLSDSTRAVWATSSMTVVGWMTMRGCELISSVSVPIPSPLQYDDAAFSFSDLSDDLPLTWDVPGCGACEAQGGRCGFQSNTSFETGCFDAPQTGGAPFGCPASKTGLPRSARYAISIGVGIPALVCFIGIACYACGKVKTLPGRRRRTAESASSTVIPQPSILLTGLDESTIESYPKVVLGESRRLPNPDDSTCSICLSEYRPTETLRSIPECKHCFHADCIDEWLRKNATCPLCRNSPTPASCAHVTC